LQGLALPSASFSWLNDDVIHCAFSVKHRISQVFDWQLRLLVKEYGGGRVNNDRR